MRRLNQGYDLGVPPVLRNYLIEVDKLDTFETPNYQAFIDILDTHKTPPGHYPCWEDDPDFKKTLKRHQKALKQQVKSNVFKSNANFFRQYEQMGYFDLHDEPQSKMVGGFIGKHDSKQGYRGYHDENMDYDQVPRHLTE